MRKLSLLVCDGARNFWLRCPDAVGLAIYDRHRLPKSYRLTPQNLFLVLASWRRRHVDGLYAFALPHRAGRVNGPTVMGICAAAQEYGFHNVHPMHCDWRRQFAVALDDVGPMTCPAYAVNPWAVSMVEGVGLYEAVDLIQSKAPQMPRESL